MRRSTYLSLTTIAGMVGILAATAPAKAQIQPASDGMFLCRSPVIANNFWDALMGVAQTGVQLNRQLAAQVAVKNECKFAASAELKPVRFVAGQLLISDGSQNGWATPNYYILYVNGRVE